MISATKKRNVSTNERLNDACEYLIRQAINNLQQSQQHAEQGKVILKAINAITPIEITNNWDLCGEINLHINAQQAKRIVKKLRAAGYIFGDATYSLTYGCEPGKETVNVQRYCTSIESGACEHAKDRLSLQWTAPYKATGKCKIVESTNTSTHRSLVCTSD